MKSKISWNRRTLIRWKIYIDRAKMYIGYINFFMIGVVFLRSFKDTIWGSYIFEKYYFTFPILIVAFLIVSLLIGYVDTRLGFREEELRNASSSNPVMMEILKTVKELNKKQ